MIAHRALKNLPVLSLLASLRKSSPKEYCDEAGRSRCDSLAYRWRPPADHGGAADRIAAIVLAELKSGGLRIDGPATTGGKSWREVQGLLLAELEAGAAPQSMQFWAEYAGCSKSTVSKVMKDKHKLRRLLNKRRPRAFSLNALTLDTTAGNEHDPAEAAAERVDGTPQERLDAVLARLLDTATPTERAKLNGMPKQELDVLCRQLLEQEADDRTRRDGKNRLMNRRP